MQGSRYNLVTYHADDGGDVSIEDDFFSTYEEAKEELDRNAPYKGVMRARIEHNGVRLAEWSKMGGFKDLRG